MQLIARCSIKPDGTQSFSLTSKPGLSGPLTSGLDQALRALPVLKVKAAISMEIIFAVADEQTQIAITARHLTRGGKAAEAVEMLAPQATNDCKNAFVWQQLGWSYSSKGDFPNAERALKRAIQLDPRDFDSWANLVSTYHSEGKVQEAEEAAKKNLDCAPNEDSMDIVNINTALYTGDWATAESILRKLCKRTGDYGTAYRVILAYALRWQGKNDEAKQLLETALKQQSKLTQQSEWKPPLDDYYAKLAEKQLALLNGDWKTAEELGRQDLSKDPKDYESLYDMGLALKGEGKLDEARKAFEAAVQPITPKSVLKAVDVQIKELSSATTTTSSNKQAQQ
jgi:tetratricopeptide (TPR) repeat protein